MNAVANGKRTGKADMRPLGRPPKQTDQRQRILQAAAKAIATNGYEQCSLADIARDLDLTRPALYHYFRTKQQIFTEIALDAMRGMYEHVRDAVDDEQTSREQLRALMLAHADYFEANYWLVNATIAGYGGIARRDLERAEEFDGYRNKYEKLLHGIIRSGIRRGEFRSVDVKGTGRSVFQLLNITRWYRPDGRKRAADIANDNFELVSSGLSA